MPGPEKPADFMHELNKDGGGLARLNEASLEVRYEMDPLNQNVVPHDSFMQFKNSELAYKLYSAGVAAQQEELLKPAVGDIGTTRQLAIIENKLPLNRPLEHTWAVTHPAEVALCRGLFEFGSIGAHNLLAAEADTRSLLEAGKYDVFGPSTIPYKLTKDELTFIDKARATVQIKRFELDKHLLDVERALHNEVCLRTGEAFADGRTWKESGFQDLFTAARNALVEFNGALQQADINKPDSLTNLPTVAEKVRSALAGLLEKRPALLTKMEQNTQKTWLDETPVTNSGLELELTLIAQEVGQQAISRIAPSYVATYRFASERPKPATTPDLYTNMAGASADEKSKVWRNKTQAAIRALGVAPRGKTPVISPTDANTYVQQVVETAKLLGDWQTALPKAPLNGPADIHRLALSITNKLRSLEQSLSPVMQNAQEVRSAIDAAYIQLRLDAYTAVELLNQV